MELVVRKNDLLKELSLLQGIVERKNTIPILANVLIDATKDGVSLLATDLDVGLRSRCEATVTKPGTLTLPAKKLFEIVSALPDTEMRIEEDKGGKSVTIAADRFESRMQTLPASEFPTPPQDGGRRRGHAAGCGAEAVDFAYAVCDHERGHAVFPERRPARAARRLDEHGRHRRPSAGVHQRARVAGQGREVRGAAAAEDAERGRAADRRRRRGRVFAGGESPVLPRRRPAADFAEDRRELSRPTSA